MLGNWSRYTILHTSDAGKTWQKQYEDIGYDAPLLSIHMFPSGEGIALGHSLYHLERLILENLGIYVYRR